MMMMIMMMMMRRRGWGVCVCVCDDYDYGEEDDNEVVEEDGFDLCAIVIKDNIEAAHWLVTPLKFCLT